MQSPCIMTLPTKEGLTMLRIGDRAKAKHLYEIEVLKDGNKQTIQVDADTRVKAHNLIVKHKLGQVFSVNMVG